MNRQHVVQTREQREITALTGLRGVAALYVAFYHLIPVTPPGLLLRTFSRHGYLGVDIFFVLSGFVMALSYGHRFKGAFCWSLYGDFLLRRLARVWPLYVVLLGVVLLLSVVGLGELNEPPDPSRFAHLHEPERLFINLIMLQGWGFGGAMVVPSWSVSTEFAAYIAFPLLLILTVRSRLALAITTGLSAACLLLCCATIGNAQAPTPNGPLDLCHPYMIYPMMRCIAGFVVGLLTFRIAASPGMALIAGSDGFGFAVLTLLLASLSLPVFDLWIYPLFPALVLALSLNKSHLAQLFSAAPIYQLGVVSYALYLVHEMIHAAFKSWTSGLEASLPPVLHHAYVGLSFLGLVGLSVGAAFVLNRFIEVPARRWIRAFSAAWTGRSMLVSNQRPTV